MNPKILQSLLRGNGTSNLGKSPESRYPCVIPAPACAVRACHAKDARLAVQAMQQQRK